VSPLPTKVAARLSAGLKRFQPILASAKSRDVNESDTVVIVADMLSEIFGYDKYSEITSEHAVRGTYCDLAIKIDGSLAFLAEVKAIGSDLRESYVKQAVDYAANQGVEWVVLTNGALWRIYKIGFGKPITNELLVEIDMASLSVRNDEHLDLLYLLSKEGWLRSRLGDYHSQKEALSRFTVAAIVLSDTLVELVRRELRRITPNLRIDVADVRRVLESEVVKRDAIEGDRADHARRLVARAAGKALRQTKAGDPASLPTPEEALDSQPTSLS
jgi:predicted type IV restriction endonuclease